MASPRSKSGPIILSMLLNTPMILVIRVFGPTIVQTTLVAFSLIGVSVKVNVLLDLNGFSK